MLNTPDIYNEFADMIDKNFKYKLENNLLPDLSKIDSSQLEKKSKKEYMAVFERLVHNCCINNDYEKSQEELKKYTENYISKSFPILEPKTITNLINNIHSNEIINIIKPSMQSFLLYVELTRNLYFYIQEKYIKKQSNNINIQIIHCFLEYSLELLNGLGILLVGSNNNSAISVYRTFYENYIVFSFLQIHPELNIAFAEHARMDECLMQKEKSKIYKTQLSEDIEKSYLELKNKYGESFEESYGWTASVITDKKKRNLKTLFEESKLDETFSFYYKLACKFSHSTSYSLQIRPNFEQIYTFLYAVVIIVKNEFNVLFGNLKVGNRKELELMKQWIIVCSEILEKNLNEF